jgi:hypothetical protein
MKVENSAGQISFFPLGVGGGEGNAHGVRDCHLPGWRGRHDSCAAGQTSEGRLQ